MHTDQPARIDTPAGRGTGPCLVVMQPSFLPWAGYFNLMARADDFVFLDDVQLEKQSWQTRNRWLIGGQVHWITVPVRHSHLAQTIAETEVVDTSHWRAKLARGFAQHYGRHRHAADAHAMLAAASASMNFLVFTFASLAIARLRQLRTADLVPEAR